MKLTPKGLATRARIVASSADLILNRGIGGTTLEDIRTGTGTSKSQLFHYFPGGKSEIVSAIASYQGQRVLDAQQPFLDSLDSWESWDGWRKAVLNHYGSQAHWGCPISALAREVVGNDAHRANELEIYMSNWHGYLQSGLERMKSAGVLGFDADPRRLALATFAALQGGLLMTQAMQSLEPLEAALDGALVNLQASAA